MPLILILHQLPMVSMFVELTEDNHKQLWVPPGYAHGFCVLSKTADFLYKCTDYYDQGDEGGVTWNDPTVAIDWPISNLVIEQIPSCQR